MNNLSPKKLFLIDAIGALTSGIMLGLILPYFEEFIGMPRHILWILALMAVIFFFYSIICYLKLPNKWRFFLRGIAIANFLYSMLTAGLVIYFWMQLTQIGKLYFIGEMVLIMSLVIMELKVSSKTIENEEYE